MRTIGFQSFYQVIETLNRLKKTITELNKLLELKSQNDIELHVQEVRKRVNQIKNEYKKYKLSDFDTFKNKVLEKLRNVKYNDLENIVYRMQLTYVEIVGVLDLKHNSHKNNWLFSKSKRL